MKRIVINKSYGSFCVSHQAFLRLRELGQQDALAEMDLGAYWPVMPMHKAAPLGDLFVTLTGDINVVRKEHFAKMKDQAILANSGHFNVEIDIPALEKMAAGKSEVQNNVAEYRLEDARRLYLLAEGRLIKLAAAYGHPPEVMDMSFANQALAVRYIVENGRRLEKKVYAVPVEIDRRVAELKLASMGLETERLTAEQDKYLHSWQMGTYGKSAA